MNDLWIAAVPSAALAALAFLVLPWCRRDATWVRATLVGLSLLLMWRYVAWRLLETLPPFGFTGEAVLGYLFAAVETITLLGASIGFIFLSRTRNRSREADANLAWLAEQYPAPLVDMFICTYNEDEDILERTIVGAMAQDYENCRVWVLDDGRRDWLRALCDRLGCRYVTRKDNAHAKAGNINNGIEVVSRLANPPDFISVLDADFVPLPNFLSRCLGLFKDPKIGVVQTPQHFFNPDPVQANLGLHKFWPDEQRYFFDFVMPAKDAWGAAFCCGTSSVLRYSALRRIGGFPTDSVTEDYLVTLRMQAHGYQTAYLNEPLSSGLAPEGLKEYITQRSRWCLGLVQIIRGPLGPMKVNGLRLVDRLSLIDAFLYWSGSFSFRIMCLLVPIFYWLFGISAMHAEIPGVIWYFGPYFLSQLVVMTWLAEGRILPVLSDVNQILTSFEIVRAVAAGLARPKGHKFKVTAKGGARDKVFVQWPLLRRFLGILVITLAGMASAFYFETFKSNQEVALCFLWSWYNVIVLGLACLVCIERPRYRRDERFHTDEPATLIVGNRTYDFNVGDLSIGGARLAGQAPAAVGTDVVVALGDMRLPGSIVRAGAGEFGIRFADDPDIRAGMIRRVYSGSYTGSPVTVRVARLTAAVVRRLGH